MEGRHFGIRKHLFDYDSVIDKQRQSIYKRRDQILHTIHDIQSQENLTKNPVIDHIVDLVQPSITDFIQTQQTLNIDKDELIELIKKEYNLTGDHAHFTDSLYHTSAQHIAAHVVNHIAEGKTVL